MKGLMVKRFMDDGYIKMEDVDMMDGCRDGYLIVQSQLPIAKNS
jgi:hypothetical protein